MELEASITGAERGGAQEGSPKEGRGVGREIEMKLI
jgi:hypothetical protein